MQIDLYREKFMSIPKKPEFKDGFQTKYFAEDPTTMVFSIFFEFDSPLLNPATNIGESAERFFQNLGDDKRVAKIVEFRERILNLIDETPYLLRSIDGLGDIYDYSSKEIYLERELTIKTHETLDLRIAKIAELYTDVVWDFENQKRILPDNLEWINYHVIVNDVRELVMFIRDYEEGGHGEYMMENVTAYLDSFIYSFRGGKFSFHKSNNFLSTISNEDPTVIDNSFRLMGGKFSKKRNRVILSNDEKSVTIDKITGRRTTKSESQLEEMSLSKKLLKIAKKKAIDFARQEATKIISEKVLDPLKAKLSDIQNSLLSFNELTLEGLISGDQKIGDMINGVKGAVNGTSTIEGKILDKELISTAGMTHDQIVNIILNDVNKRLAYEGD